MHDPRVDQPYVVERGPRPKFAAPSTRRALATAEVGLVLVSLAAAFSFTRVFDSFGFVVPVTVTTLVAHALGAVLRRRRWRSLAALPLTVFAVASTTAALCLRPTIRADIAAAWSIFNNTRAPVPATRAFVLATSLLVGLAVVTADWLAFRRRALFGALLPALVVFGFTAMFGDHRHRLLSLVLLAMTSVCFALAHRLAFFDRGSGWMINRSPSRGRFVMSGLAVSSCAVLVALAIGPSLPGASNQALVSWRDIGNGWAQQQDGVTLAPLVSVRAQLVEPSDTEVFDVQANQSDYWRLTSLDVFDGVEWSASAATAATVTLPTIGATNASRQVITIKALRGNWLPTPFAPVSVQIAGNDAVFEPDSATLVSTDRLGKGDSYTVWSSPTAAAVAAPTATDVTVPRAVRQRLSVLANQIVRDAGAVTTTQKAQALEAYFLDNFTYDLNVAAGSSITDITTFLQRRSGYCEQFAATFAAMARVLGIPSRVAIGYRLGTYDSAKGVYRVTGHDAHAWPEVYITGQGWVRFEPTPSSAGASTDPSTAAAASAADAAAVGASPSEAPATTAPTATATDPTVDPSSADGTVAIGHASDRHALALVAVLVLVVLAAPMLVGRLRTRRAWRRVRHDRRGQIAWMWHDALRWLRIAGIDARATDTPLEVGRRAAVRVSRASSDIVELARLVTAACYAQAGPDQGDIDAARNGVDRIERAVKAHVGKAWRLRSYRAHFRMARRSEPTGLAPPPSRLPIADW